MADRMTIAVLLPPSPKLIAPSPSEQKGLSWLLSMSNQDGGIAAANPGDPSGPWTTSVAISAIVYGNSDSTVLSGMVNYLLGSQISSAENDGSWPLVSDLNPSTLATADCLRALVAVERAQPHGVDVTSVAAAKGRAVSWLLTNQLPNGGWPEGSKVRGQRDSLFASCSAFMALVGCEAMPAQARQRATNYILSLHDANSGGWRQATVSGIHEQPVTVSDTARTVVCLLSYTDLNADNQIIASGVKFLRRSVRTLGNVRSQKVTTAVYGAGESVVNNNSVCDVAIGLAIAERKMRRSLAKVVVFLDSSFDHALGIWNLQDKNHSESITTWPTGDWLLTLAAIRQLLQKPNEATLRKARWILAIPWVVLALAVTGASILGWRNHDVIETSWLALPQNTRTLIVWGVVVALVVGVAAAALWDSTKLLWNKVKERSRR